MSPTRKASSVDGLRRGVAGAPAAESGVGSGPQNATPDNRSVKTKPVRVTLNFPPELFRQLDHWTREAADEIGVPRIGVQDAVRAMVRVMLDDSIPAGAKVRARLREDRH